MAIFRYQAKSPNGKLSDGTIEARSTQEAIAKLRTNRLQPLKLIASGTTLSAKGSVQPSMFSSRVKPKDLQIFTRQFSTLINAGIPVVDALKILSRGLRDGTLKEAAGQVTVAIESGKRLADSMAQCPQVFDRFYVNMIRAGEEAGILDNILNRLSVYMEKSQKLKSQVIGALIYPAVIIFVAIIVVIVILIFIIPKFEELFKGSGQEPPALTKMVVGLSHSLADQWYIALAIVILVPYGFLTYIKTPAGKTLFDRTIMFAPIIGEAAQKASIAKLSRTLSTLLGSGVGLVEAIEIAARTAGNDVIETSLLRCREAVLQGKPFTTPLAKEKAFPPMVVQMIAIGEQSGSVDAMLGKIADFYEDEVETALKALTSLIEPLLMVVLGMVIAILVLAMYLPIFNLSSTVGN